MNFFSCFIKAMTCQEVGLDLYSVKNSLSSLTLMQRLCSLYIFLQKELQNANLFLCLSFKEVVQNSRLNGLS